MRLPSEGRAARIPVANELLADWLCLPEGNCIKGVFWENGNIVFWVEGPDMPLVENYIVPEITPTYRKKAHELVSLGKPRP